jgi:GTPase SAR1 family protein
MRILKNKLSKIPAIKSNVDDTADLPYIPINPLPCKSFMLYIIGSPGSGKTSTMMSLLSSHPTKKKPDTNCYYWKFFDNIFLISGSLSTLPTNFTKLLPEDKQFNQFSDELVENIVENLYEGDNENSLLILDDVIKDLKRSKIMSKICLNRRHCTHNSEKENQSGLSIFIISQKYTLLPLEYRNATSDFIIFKTSNFTELKRIKEELCTDLTDDEFNSITKSAWKNKYSFLYIKINENKKNKYYSVFDKIIFDDDEDFEETIEI